MSKIIAHAGTYRATLESNTDGARVSISQTIRVPESMGGGTWRIGEDGEGSITGWEADEEGEVRTALTEALRNKIRRTSKAK